jgi:hypothetical protein
MLTECLQHNIVTGSDGLPKTDVSAIGQLHLVTTPLVLLSSGWERDNLAELVNGPFAWPWPEPLGPLEYNFLQFLILSKEDDSEAPCDEFCQLATPFAFPHSVISNLEPWILPYTHILEAGTFAEEDIASIVPIHPTVLRIKKRTFESGATEVEGATSIFSNGIADPVVMDD